jgi:hypothetical protein
MSSKKAAVSPPALDTCKLRWTALPSALPAALRNASTVHLPAHSSLAASIRQQIRQQTTEEGGVSSYVDVTDDDVALLLNGGALFAASPAASGHFVPISLSDASVTLTPGASMVYHPVRDEVRVLSKSVMLCVCVCVCVCVCLHLYLLAHVFVSLPLSSFSSLHCCVSSVWL